MGESLALGRRRGLLLALGISIGTFTWSASTALGVSIVLVNYPALATLLLLAGGGYFVWMGTTLLRAAYESNSGGGSHSLSPPPPAPARRKTKKEVLKGLAISLTNPKAALVSGGGDHRHHRHRPRPVFRHRGVFLHPAGHGRLRAHQTRGGFGAGVAVCGAGRRAVSVPAGALTANR